MRLALNFPRIDPTRGGAETYIVDLCRSLVRAGPPGRSLRRKLEGGIAPSRGPLRRGRRNRQDPQPSRSGTSPATPRRPWRQADYDCTVGFINTWAHDVIIPQGGVHAGSLQANSLAVHQRD